MGAVDACLFGQRGQSLEARPHLRRLAFEEAPAAKREQGVPHEGYMICGVEIGDMAEGMATAGDHLQARLAQLDDIARQLNTRPRRILGYATPAEAFSDYLVATAT